MGLSQIEADPSASLPVMHPVLDRVISSEYSHLVVVGAPALKSDYGLDSGFPIGLDTELAPRQAVSDVTSSSETDVTSQLIDFSEMGSVRAAAAGILSRFPVVDGLVLSVGAYIQHGPTLLPSGHGAMFATNVMGPFLLTELLTERLQQSNAIVVHVIAPFHEDLDWMDLESLRNHKTGRAFNRTKTCNWAIAGELGRRYAGSITSVAFDPTFVIDKTDPTLSSRWPSGLVGLFWKLLTVLMAKPPLHSRGSHRETGSLQSRSSGHERSAVQVGKAYGQTGQGHDRRGAR